MKRVLTIQDISCVGQCSLTVALPIISSFGIETAEFLRQFYQHILPLQGSRLLI